MKYKGLRNIQGIAMLFIVVLLVTFAYGAVTLTPDGERIPPTALIAAPQDLIAAPAWADLGGEIFIDRYQVITIWIELDINLSNNARVRLLAKTENGGTNEYVFPIKTVAAASVSVEDEFYEFNVDADQLMVISFDLDKTIPWGQFQVQAGTLGGTAAQIDSAYYSAGK